MSGRDELSGSVGSGGVLGAGRGLTFGQTAWFLLPGPAGPLVAVPLQPQQGHGVTGSRPAQKVPVQLSRTFSSSARRPRNKVPEAQKLFQEDNGLPVHIKGGPGDVLLYRITMGLAIAGTCYSLYMLLVASMPQKKA